MSVTINKNGRTFIVECIIFQDASFEISINDVTQEEEQVRLKRQLTQNIAHELKTPVSSIQGIWKPLSAMKIFHARRSTYSSNVVMHKATV